MVLISSMKIDQFFTANFTNPVLSQTNGKDIVLGAKNTEMGSNLRQT